MLGRRWCASLDHVSAHAPLRSSISSLGEVDAKAAIAEIAADAVSIVDPTTLWPAHPMDDGVRDGHGSLYFGAAGVIWALDYLRREQVISDAHDLTPLTTTALERNAPWFATTAYSRHASLLMGELGILLVQMRVHRIRASPTRSTRSLPPTVSCQSWSSCGGFPAVCSAAFTCAP